MTWQIHQNFFDAFANKTSMARSRGCLACSSISSRIFSHIYGGSHKRGFPQWIRTGITPISRKSPSIHLGFPHIFLFIGFPSINLGFPVGFLPFSPLSSPHRTPKAVFCGAFQSRRPLRTSCRRATCSVSLDRVSGIFFLEIMESEQSSL